MGSVRTDVSENISPPSSGFLKVLRSHIYVTMESLLMSLSIEGYCVALKNTALWDAFTAVSMIEVF
jgi:hypothetical protein